MSMIASQITSLTIVYSTVYSRHRSKKTSKLRVTGLCAGNSPGPVNSAHKGPVTRKSFHLMTSSCLANAFGLFVCLFVFSFSNITKIHSKTVGTIREIVGLPRISGTMFFKWPWLDCHTLQTRRGRGLCSQCASCSVLFLSGSRRRVDVSKYPRDKVTLFGIPRAPYAPSMSPFPLKLETYLRMAKVPYQVRSPARSLALYWRHVSIRAYQITGKWAVCSTSCSG